MRPLCSLLALCLVLSQLWLTPPPARAAEGEDDPLWNRPSFEQKIYKIGQRILAANGIQERIAFRYDGDTKDINGYARRWGTPNTIMVNKALLNFIENDDELAALLGHEIAHITKRHTRKIVPKMVASKVALGTAVAAATVGVGILALPLYPALLRKDSPIYSPISRPYEAEADLVGIDYMVKAGYNPLHMETLMTKITGDAGPFARAFSDHPVGAERLADIRKHIAEHYPQFLQGEVAGNLPGAPFQHPNYFEIETKGPNHPATPAPSLSGKPLPSTSESSEQPQPSLPEDVQAILETGSITPAAPAPSEAAREEADPKNPVMTAPKEVTVASKATLTAPKAVSVPGSKKKASTTAKPATSTPASIAEVLLNLTPDQQKLLKLLAQQEFADGTLMDLHYSHLTPEGYESMLWELEKNKLIRVLGEGPQTMIILTDQAAALFAAP